jgi:type IVB pilus formation R64 PilN family outer membrane protein
MQGKLSIWEDLQKGLDNLKSADGKVWVSEATTTVTVKDHPENVRDMTRYINELNQIMAEQVSIRVQVFELDLNKEHAYGIDWNQLMGSIKGTDLLFSGGGAAAAVVGSNVAGGTSALSSLTINTKNGRGTAILNALATQGKLSVVTEPTLVTMNNQVAEVRITKDTGYLQSLTATSAGLGSAEQSLTPGIVTDGFSLYLLPKIQGDDIYLQISSSLSTLTKLEKISSAPTNSGSEKDAQRAAQEGFEAIQVPTLQEKHFNQRTVLHTGSTLLISGFQQLRDALNQNGLMGTKIPNGIGDKNNHVQTIVLITPTILRGQTSS